MTNPADLHMHSFYSPDGEMMIADLLLRCQEAGLKTVSVTDHNSVKGISEAIIEGRDHGMYVIPGIEIDCNFEGTDLHLLGYHVNWAGNDFKVLEEEVSGQIMNSFTVMIRNLHLLGIDVDMPEVLNKAAGKLPTAELIAEVLLENPEYQTNRLLDPYRPGGSRGDMPYINFYLDFFAQGKPAYVKTDFMDYGRAVQLVRDNHGIPVVAHPGLNFNGKEKTVGRLIDEGALGLEVFNNYHSDRQIEFFAGLAKEKKLLMTCGSDFHGKTKPLIKPGAYKTLPGYETLVADSVLRLVN